MSNRTPPPPTWATWLSGRAFVGVGVLLALSALALPAWWLAHPQGSVETPAEPDVPTLLPETPLREDLARFAVDDTLPRPTPVAYATVERQATQPPARLVIPAIDLDAPITPVGWATIEVGGETFGQWQVPDAAMVGWHDTSAGLGQLGNTVLNGHHNLYGEVFRRLVELQAGDELRLSAGEVQRTYVVSETVILLERGQPIEVRLANAERILPADDERVTLVTCWPYSGNSHRLVVVAKPAPYNPFRSFTQ